MILPANHSE